MDGFQLNFNKNKPYIFVSYKSEDKVTVNNSIRYLQERYGMNIWYDADLTAGLNWDKQAVPILRSPNCLLVLFFASELALCSPNIKKELKKARFYKKLIVPINFSMESFYEIHINDIVRKYNEQESEKVDNAEEIITNYLDTELTYIYLHQPNYFESLVKSVKKIINKKAESAKKIDDDKFNAENKGPNQKTIEEYISDYDVFIHEKKELPKPQMDNSIVSEIATTSVDVNLNIESEIIDKEEENAYSPINVETDKIPKRATKKVIVSNKETNTKPKKPSSSKKNAAKQREQISSTGSLIDFSLYDMDYRGNQSDMMLLIFEKVIEKHPDKINQLHEELTSVSLVDKNDNIVKGHTTTYNTNKIYNINGNKYSVGTNFGISAKLSQIAKLINICDEEQSILKIDGHELPNIRPSGNIKKAIKQREEISSSGSLIDFSLYGRDYRGNQSDMMLLIFENVIEKHPEKINQLHEELTSVSLVDKNNNNLKEVTAVFRTNKIFETHGIKYCVGTSYGMNNKLVQIAKLLSICNEQDSKLKIDGYVLP